MAQDLQLIAQFNNCSPNNNFSIATDGKDSINSSMKKTASFEIINLIASLVMIVLGLVGFLGNLLSMWVYSRPYMKSAVNILMLGLAFCDASMCITGVAVFAPPGFYAYFGHRSILTIIAYLLVFIYPLALSAQTASVWTLVVITVERFIAVSFPLKARTWLTLGRTRWTMWLTCVLAFAYNAVRFFEYEIVWTNNSAATFKPGIRNDEIYTKYYFHWAYLMLIFVIPFMILVTLNGYIVWIIHTARNQREQVSNRQTKEHKTTTVMVVIVVLTFLVCNTVPLVINFFEVTVPSETLAKLPWFYTLVDACNILVLVNSSINVLIYLTFSRRYRLVAALIIKQSMTRRCSPNGGHTTFIPTQYTSAFFSNSPFHNANRRRTFVSVYSRTNMTPNGGTPINLGFSSNLNNRRRHSAESIEHLNMANLYR